MKSEPSTKIKSKNIIIVNREHKFYASVVFSCFSSISIKHISETKPLESIVTSEFVDRFIDVVILLYSSTWRQLFVKWM